MKMIPIDYIVYIVDRQRRQLLRDSRYSLLSISYNLNYTYKIISAAVLDIIGFFVQKKSLKKAKTPKQDILALF